MKSIAYLSEYQYYSSFFSIIYKDFIFLFINYEKFEQNIACKADAGDALSVFTRISAQKGVAKSIKHLQIQNRHQTVNYHAITNKDLQFYEVSPS